MGKTYFTFYIFILIFNDISFLEDLDLLVEPVFNATPMNPFESPFTALTTSDHWVCFVHFFLIADSAEIFFRGSLLFIFEVVLFKRSVDFGFFGLYDLLLLVSDLSNFQIY